MRATVLNMTIGVRLDEGGVGQSTLVLDPTEVEERDLDASITIGMDGQRDALVSCLSAGAPLDAAAWASCVEAGAKSCKVLEAFLRMSLQKRLETFIKSPQ